MWCEEASSLITCAAGVINPSKQWQKYFTSNKFLQKVLWKKLARSHANWAMRYMSGVSWRIAVSHVSLLLLILISPLYCICSYATPAEGDFLLEVVRDWNGDVPVSWVPGTDPCRANWTLVTCDLNAISIVALNLSNTGLQGPVPVAIGNLTSLQSLDIGNVKNKHVQVNAVNGDLSALAPLQPTLQELYTSFDVLGVQSYPEVLFNLTNLVVLKTDNCMIPGPFPLLTNLTKLEILWLGNNSFTGPIPSEVATMISLRELTMWGNNINSMLPPELGNLGNLTYLNCEKCNLWGPLPAEIGKLVHLQRLYLNSNAFTGPIPQEWKALTSISVFDLEANYLYSTVEPWLLGLNNVSHLFISDNQLYGQLPSINNTNTKATEVGIDCNYFTGNKPVLGPTLAWDSKIYGNCFSNSTDQTGTDTYCTAGVLNCQAFQRYVAANECPPCPPNQYLINSTLCICYQVQSSTSKKFPAGAVVGICIAAVVVLLAMAIFLFLWMRRKQQQFYKPDHDYFNSHDVQTWEAPKGVKRFYLQDLAKATNGFDKEHEIGSGGFGKVFIGTFPDGRTLAIKRGSGFAYTPESQSEFKNEVLLLSRLHHKNLVHLEGFCDESHLQILVYEYMKNGNLHGHLFTRKGAKYLDWYKRLEISVQIAQGLDYLHSFADPPVIHRDVKPSNILLDENLVAKVSDFGISRETPEFFSHVSTRLAGTAGYIDPQYFMKRQLTPASDVYSYGVVLLELVTGQRAINENSQGDELNNLVQWATPRLEEGGIETIVDAQLEGNYPRDIYQDMAELAVMCAAYEKESRPSIKVILAILEPHLESAQCPVSVNDPWSLVGSTTPDTEIPSNPYDSPVSNEMSLTVTEPR